MSDDVSTYDDHLDVCRDVVLQNPSLCPTEAEWRVRRGNYLPLISLASIEGRRRGLVLTKFLLAKLIGKLVRGEVK